MKIKPTTLNKSLLITFCILAITLFAQKTISAQPASINDSVFTKVDKPAAFTGGSQAWANYLQENLKYPNKAIKKNIQGIVRVQFLVDKAGNISEVQALNDPGGGLMEEAVRIIKNGPKWQPAEQNGKNVIYRHIQSITFRLE